MIAFVPTSSHNRGAVFPPTLAVAKAAVDRKLVREATSRWIAYACAVALAFGHAGVLEAYRVLTQVVSVAGRRFASSRVCAAANAAAVLSLTGARSHLLVAQHELRIVEGIGDAADSVLGGLIGTARAVHDALEVLRVYAPLRWGENHEVLYPGSPLAGLRMEHLPTSPLEGTWPGVRGILRNHGLEPVGDAPAPVVRLVRSGLALRVEPIGEQELLEHYAPPAVSAGAPPAADPDGEEGPSDEDLAAIDAEGA